MAQRGAWTPQKVRERIRTTMLALRLQNHVLGKIEMSPTQLRAAEILLRKTLPDLTAVAHSGAVELKRPDECTDAELADIALTGGLGIVAAPQSADEAGELH
jgi:hypothetical protein